MQGGQLMVKQVFGLHAGLVSGDDGELAGQHGRCDVLICLATFGQQLPQGQGLTRNQFMDDGPLTGGGIAQRLQQAGLQLGEEMPFFSVVTRFCNLTTQGKPLLVPGA